MLTLYTVQLAQWRKVKKLKIELIDTTVKSGDARLAPTWDIVTNVKAGKISEANYIHEYKKLMRISFRTYLVFWHELLSKESIAIAC